MGVITCTAPMNPTGDVTYTHKKFKRAASEVYDNVDQLQKQPQQQQSPPPQRQLQLSEQTQPQHRDGGKHCKTEIVEAGARPTTVTVSGQSLMNGHLPAQLPYQLNSNVGGQLSLSDGEEVKRKNSGSGGGKYKCEYCGVGCAKPSVLGKHIRTHTNERPFSCDQCRIAFKTKSNYLKHTKSRAHVLKCDGVVQEGGGGESPMEVSDSVDADRVESPRCPPTMDGLGTLQVQQQPADLSMARSSRDPHSSVASTAPRLHPEELIKDRGGKSLYKPKFRAQYSLQEEEFPKGSTPPLLLPPPLLGHHPTPPPHDASKLDSNTSNSLTYQPHAASSSNSNSHSSSPGQHAASPAQFSKQCLPPLDIRAAAATGIKKEDSTLPGQRSSGVTPSSANALWKGMKSPSPELLNQHINKLIVENQAIVETHNPLWSRRYRRQSSLGSSSSESDGSGSNKSRRSSLVDTSSKITKLSATGPPASFGAAQSHSRERSHSLTGEALLIEPPSSYSPSLPPNPHLPLAQPPVTLLSASKPSISSHGPTTSYSQSDPAFATSHMGTHDLDSMEGPRKRSISEGPGILRDSPKGRLHLKNSESSVIKNLVGTVRAGIINTMDQNFERLEHGRILGQNAGPADGGLYMCTWCKVRCRSPESLEYHVRHYCGHRQAGSGSERGTPDSIKSGDGGRWSGEQDVALDLQKKDRMDLYDHERSSSRGSSISVGGEPIQRRGSDEDIKYRLDLSPRVYGNEALIDGASPPTKKRKMSEPEPLNHDKVRFLSPMFSSKSNKNDCAMQMMDEMNKHKSSSRHFFGGEVQICDGKNLKTMRIDPSQQPNPTIDICIPPQQLGGSIPRSEASVPTSVVVTIAKSGLNSGGTMVQVESQMSTSSTKTVTSLVNSLLPQEQHARLDAVNHPNKIKAPTHPQNLYHADAARFPFAPSFYQYAPLLPLPNLTIPGIPTPDLSYSMNRPPNVSSQTFLHGNTHIAQKHNSYHSPVVHSRVSSLPLSQTTAAGSFVGGAGEIPVRSSPMTGTHSGPSLISAREKEREHRKSSSYPALIPMGNEKASFIPMGNEKVPYVPGIPGPYSQAGSVLQPQLHSIQKSPLAVFTPPVPAPTLSPAMTKISSFPAINKANFTSAPSLIPFTMNEGKEKHLSVPKLREVSRESPRSPAKDVNLFVDSPKYSPRIVSHVPSPKDLHGYSERPKLPLTPVKPLEVKTANPEIRIHPVISSPVFHPDKKDSEKNLNHIESQDVENSIKEDSDNSKDFLLPRKRPNSLPLKPQPFMPKSDSLIGTTLVSPDTPRPKKSCVQMLLNGSAYTYLGHKVSTKSYFCCINKQQPMYVPQSTDPKLSMYSNWQTRKSAEDNPLGLTPYQSLGLYQSRKYNHAYTIAKEKELNLVQTHSSYWTFKEEKEKNKDKEEEEDKVKSEDKDEKTVTPSTKASDASSPETSGLPIKREPEDQSDESSSKTDEGEGYKGSAKRIKIFEGGFKSTEEYTYVRGRGRGRYVCGACGIRCKKPSMLKKHIRTHTDLRPYACGHCSFSFKTKGNLTKHLRSKAHYKRCVEMGIVPVPTVVDDSHVNEEALALQGKMEQERIDDDEDDDDEDDDDDDDEGDEDDEDDEAMDEDQFEDADDYNEQDDLKNDSEKECQPMKEIKDTSETVTPAVPAVSRAGVLVLMPGITSTLGSSNQGPKEGKGPGNIVSGDSPMDLTIKKGTVPSSAVPHDKTISVPHEKAIPSSHEKALPVPHEKAIPVPHEKTISIKKHSVPARPNFLPLLSKSSIGDLRSPIGSLASPGTPSTPIRELPSEILSPVTESSTLLKSIYNTTKRISNVSSGESLNIVPDPTKGNGCNSLMLQAYLKERAVLDTTFKRQQYKSSSSDTSPDSPRTNSATPEIATPIDMEVVPDVPQKADKHTNGNIRIITSDFKKEGKDDVPASLSSNLEQSRSSTPSSIINATSVAMTSRILTPPVNLTVVNTGGTNFIAPSGKVPTSLNRWDLRLGNDDGKCKCSICHKEFNKQSQLSIHMNIHYMERPFRCDSCAVSFRTNGHLQKHKRSLSHFNKVNMNMTFGTPSTDNPRPFKCHDCKIAFRIHGHLAKHLRSKMHIMKLECLGKLPFGTYAEIERSGANLNEIDTTDCDNSLESLQSMAQRLYEKEPGKLASWQSQQDTIQHRVRTISNSSTNSDDYPLQDEQEDPLSSCGIDDDTEGDDDEELAVPQETGRISIPGTVLGPPSSESCSPQVATLQTIEIGSQQLTQKYSCGLCEAKFSSHTQLILHSQKACIVKSS